MKKGLLIAAAALLTGFAAQAQNYMVVNTEKVFKAIPAYVTALETLDKQTEASQKYIDDTYAQIETLFQDYQKQKAYMSEATRVVRENEIVMREQEVLKYQEEMFGADGELLKKRIELIKPIQDKVFAAISKYAADNKYQLVLDLAANPTILYYVPAADKTEEIIKLTK